MAIGTVHGHPSEAGLPRVGTFQKSVLPTLLLIGLATMPVLAQSPRQVRPAVARPQCYQLQYRMTDNGRTIPGRLDYDRGRFRLEYLLNPGAGAERVIQMHDTDQGQLAWSLDPRRKVAYPTPGSSTAGMEAVMARIGEGKARKKYGIPAAYPVRPRNAGITPEQGWMSPQTVHAPQMRKVGEEKLLGRPCKVYEAHLASPRPGFAIATDRTVEASPSQSLKVWADKDTGVILRWVRRLDFGTAPIAPQETRFEATRFTPVRSLPRRLFQLPAGTQANVPLLFADVRLPKGVKPVRMKGAFAGTGVNLSLAGR